MFGDEAFKPGFHCRGATWLKNVETDAVRPSILTSGVHPVVNFNVTRVDAGRLLMLANFLEWQTIKVTTDSILVDRRARSCPTDGRSFHALTSLRRSVLAGRLPSGEPRPAGEHGFYSHQSY